MRTLLTFAIAIACGTTVFAQQRTKTPVCERIVTADSVRFCLPHISGYSELSNSPEVRELFKSAILIGVYYNDHVDDRYKDQEVKYDDYFMVSVEDAGVAKPSEALLKFYSKMLTNQMIVASWDQIKKEIVMPKNLQGTKVNVPIILDNYSPFKDVYSYLMVQNKIVDGQKKTMMVVINLFLLKGKICSLMLWDIYKPVDKKDEVMRTSDRLLKSFLDANRK